MDQQSGTVGMGAESAHTGQMDRASLPISTLTRKPAFLSPQPKARFRILSFMICLLSRIEAPGKEYLGHRGLLLNLQYLAYNQYMFNQLIKSRSRQVTT